MNTSHSEFIVQLQKKRLILERLVIIAIEIERMDQGLLAMLDLQNNSFEIQEDTLHFLTLISENITDYSTSNVTDVLNSFDHRVHKSLNKVLNLALIEISRDMDKEVIESTSTNLNKFIEQFKKDVQTSIALRLLLKERGADIPAFKCGMPIKTIKERIEELEKKEDMLRYSIDIKINTILEEVSLFLNDLSIPTHMRAEINKVHDELCQKKEHLKSGKSFSDITMTLESIDLSTDNTGIEHSVSEQEEENTSRTIQKKKTKPHTLLKRIRVWVTTPLQVSWKETKYYSKDI